MVDFSVALRLNSKNAATHNIRGLAYRKMGLAWVGLVLPALALNYLGQGALLLSDPAAIENPFYRLFPEPLLLPMVVFAAVATIIASQAVITGAYSLARQAIQLGLLPRLEVRHTSEEQSGQIYMPQVNALLLVGVLFLVLMFRSSSQAWHRLTALPSLARWWSPPSWRSW